MVVLCKRETVPLSKLVLAFVFALALPYHCFLLLLPPWPHGLLISGLLGPAFSLRTTTTPFHLLEPSIPPSPPLLALARPPSPPPPPLSQVVNVIVPSTAFIGRHGWKIIDEWYPTGGQIILNSLVTDFIFVGFLVDRMRPDVLFFRRFLAKRAHTQRQMNALYKREPTSSSPPPLPG